MATRVAINGFGRIGRNVLRTSINEPEIDIVHINDLTPLDLLVHLLKYDSVHGQFNADVQKAEGGISVNGKFISTSAIKDPSALPWTERKVDVAMECTGLFRTRDQAAMHLTAGAKRVIISAPGIEPDATVCVGVNEGTLKADHTVISNASCTTNCLAPMAKVLDATFGIEEGLITTIHSYTMDQRLLDSTHKDFRRARAAAQNMVPTTTGAAAAVGLVLPGLSGKLNGMSVRVPTPNVSIVDLVFRSSKPMTSTSINQALADAADGSMSGVLAFSTEPLVSSDLIGNPHSTIIDGLSTQTMGSHMAKVLAWYDNEWGFSNRMVDLTKTIASLG